ncbi:MAG: translation initiation factor IF-3 [Candidatus Niyogibacteria bacterium]|nr:translation initiation factor IF-3 [Candidatus Niyogibacteria bacterium]
MRVIGPDGKNLDILKTEEALLKAKEAGLDLIEIAPTANPPVAKIMDYGKYRYEEERKSKNSKKIHQSETREIRVGLGTSEHDLEMKAKKASDFLKDGDRLKIDMLLRGREKYLDQKFLNGRLTRILNYITMEHQIVEGPKRGPRGPHIIVERKNDNKQNK